MRLFSKVLLAIVAILTLDALLLWNFIAFEMEPETNRILILLSFIFVVLFVALNKTHLQERYAISKGKIGTFFYLKFVGVTVTAFCFFIFAIWTLFSISVPKYYTLAFGYVQTVQLTVSETDQLGVTRKNGNRICSKSLSFEKTNVISRVCNVTDSVFENVTAGEQVAVRGNASIYGVFASSLTPID